MANLITFLIIAAIVGGAGVYIYKAKKRGVKCIGCPAGEACGKQGGSSCSGGCASCGGCQHHP
ncbi:MAG: FeoB-associated Cys-rich membrane protein [Clostridia bacterium]|nr:FeoB-associated Cys-rich membrane protein [Clostridia bacterium]